MGRPTTSVNAALSASTTSSGDASSYSALQAACAWTTQRPLTGRPGLDESLATHAATGCAHWYPSSSPSRSSLTVIIAAQHGVYCRDDARRWTAVCGGASAAACGPGQVKITTSNGPLHEPSSSSRVQPSLPRSIATIRVAVTTSRSLLRCRVRALILGAPTHLVAASESATPSGFHCPS